jgi:hypothetical protein
VGAEDTETIEREEERSQDSNRDSRKGEFGDIEDELSESRSEVQRESQSKNPVNGEVLAISRASLGLGVSSLQMGLLLVGLCLIIFAATDAVSTNTLLIIASIFFGLQSALGTVHDFIEYLEKYRRD